MAEDLPRLRFILSAHQAGRRRWSRTHGAMGPGGKGEAAWERLVRLPMAVVGCGRSGSLLADALARLGVRDLTFLDPDRLEPHNLGEMAVVGDADVGRTKADALAGRLRDLLPSASASYRAVTVPVQRPEGLAALRRCRMVVCGVDRDEARVTVGIVACLFHLVLLDIGVGIHFDATGAREMGADIRLIVPGDGCLLCRGGVRDPHAFAHLAASPPVEPEPWETQRAGSLLSLNQVAVGLGMRLLEDLVAERVGGSVWLQVAFDAQGRMTVMYPPLEPPTRACGLCQRAGQGDARLRWR